MQLLRLLHGLEFSYVKIQYFIHFILTSVWIQRYLPYTLDYNPILLCIIFQFCRISFGIVSMNSSIACVSMRAHAHTLAHTHTPPRLACLFQALPHFLVLQCPSEFSCIFCAPMPESVILPGTPGLLETCLLLANGVSFTSCKRRLLFNSWLTRPK